jgi:DNA topoisomerase I
MQKNYELIITEKPAASLKIADALSEGKVIKHNEKGVSYYELTYKGKDIVVACAVGHLYTLIETEKNGFEYPVFSIEWVPSYENSKESNFTEKYLNVLKKLSKNAKYFTVATDYDVEGEVIGHNVIKYACKQKDAQRMKFSTLTKEDLVESYDNKLKTIDWGQANAGLTRHELDWYYGINLSRALTSSVKAAGSFKVLSSGRVQGPALKILVDKEKEIQAFKSVPYWQIEMKADINSEKISAWHIEDKFWDKQKADDALKKSKVKNAVVYDVNKKSFKQQAPYPFDLTTLQTEAYSCFGISPKDTLAIAQELYTAGLISYPRTSSQKLSDKIGFKKIINQLSKNDIYSNLCKEVLKTSLKPNNGKKDDPAHPAIYPTGINGSVDGRNFKIYDLIVKRFFATFGNDAVRETLTLDLDANSEHYICKGTRTVEEGWHLFYKPYVKLEEQSIPKCSKGDNIKINSLNIHDKHTQPPKRYTPASIIKELEKRGLGTKSTRASIIETLYERNYVKDKAITATDLGIKTVEILEKYASLILDEELTKQFEEEMEEIRSKNKKPEQILSKAQELLIKVLEDFRKKEVDVGKELILAYRETQDEENTLGNCNCNNGSLMIKRGKFGRFVACSNYPDCKITFKLPQTGLIKKTKNICEHCQNPLIQILTKGKKQELCINPSCSSKQDDKIKEEIDKKCPKCGNDLLVRSSIYGKFIGCSNYPKCKYTEKTETQENSNNDLL